MEEKVGEKANKQTVAQALHRKANKPEIETVLAKKADISDLQRIIVAVDNKIDLASFEALVRAMEMKADRHEVLPSSFRNLDNHQDRQMHFGNERRLIELEKQTQLLNRDLAMQTEQIKSLVNLNFSSKADTREIDNLSHILLGKADIGKVQELVAQLRNEVVAQIGQVKKESAAKNPAESSQC